MQLRPPEDGWYRPESQMLQNFWFSLVCALPAVHRAQRDLPLSEAYRPATHGIHDFPPDAPCALPGSHGMQSRDPGAGWFLPDGHASHKELPGTSVYRPAPQDLHEVARGPEWVPSGQVRQNELFPSE